jgi:thiol-disulfide isomerase/thioredoxin
MRSLFFIFLVLAFFNSASAQNKVKAKLTETTSVKDTAGTPIPFEVWKNLAMSSDISLRPENPSDENSPFIIYRLTKEQKQKMMESLPRPTESKAFKTGVNFSSFNETDINGNRYKTKDLKGKVIVLNFWFINCPPCKMEIPELNELVAAYKENKDVIFIAIALDEKYEIKEFLKRSPFNYNIIDRGTSLASSYRVTSFPTHVVIDKEGKIKFHTMGLAKNTVHWLKKSIEEVLTAPAPAEGGASGR